MTRKRHYVNNTLEEDLEEKEYKWLEQKYLPFLSRQGLAETSETNYLQAVRKLLTKAPVRPWEITEENLKQQSEIIAGEIQDSVYQTRGGETSKRRKSLLWKTWKHIIEIQGFDTGDLPSYKPSEKGKVNSQARGTRPEDLPNTKQVQKFVKAVGKHSGEKTTLRNQALVLLLWDKGPRIGEALNIQLKDCEIKNDKLEIYLYGNKKSDNRKVSVFQGRLTLKEFVETHPGSGDDYLFSDLKHSNYSSPVSSRKFADKILEVARKENVSFKVQGEPNHIFRKAMSTAHVVNDWATWEEVTQIQGKSVSGTKPTYLKMAVSDANASIGEKIGANTSEETEELDHHMRGSPLLPQRCRACDKLNKCFVRTCQYCGGDVETTEKTDVSDKDDLDLSDEGRQALKAIGNNPDLMEKIRDRHDK